MHNVSNNNLIMNNSKNDSTNLFLNSSLNNISIDLKKFEIKDNKENNIKITIEKILFKTKINIIYSIKIIIIIFIILKFIFIAYYICKLVVTLVFIPNFRDIISDFKDLTAQYNQILRY